MTARKSAVIRTVRKGTVSIEGVRYRPKEHHRAYDGRCDGHRFLFGRYPKSGGGWLPMISICTTERALRSDDPDEWKRGPDVVEGTLPWLFWEAVP